MSASMAQGEAGYEEWRVSLFLIPQILRGPKSQSLTICSSSNAASTLATPGDAADKNSKMSKRAVSIRCVPTSNWGLRMRFVRAVRLAGVVFAKVVPSAYCPRPLIRLDHGPSCSIVRVLWGRSFVDSHHILKQLSLPLHRSRLP